MPIRTPTPMIIITNMGMIILVGIGMNSAALYRLMSWMSPSYPVGAFSYSHGLEWEVEEGVVHDAESLALWLIEIIERGSGHNDAILFAHAHAACSRRDDAALHEAADYALAFAASAERRLETLQQGRAFCDVTCRTWGAPTLERIMAERTDPIAYPVAMGIAAADHDIVLPSALEAYMHAFAANLISAGVRLIPLGHSDGQRVTMRLEGAVASSAASALHGDLSLMTSSMIMADIGSMKHETQYTRLFRS